MKINLSIFVFWSNSIFLFFSFRLKRKKNEKNVLLRNIKDVNIDFHICFKVPMGPTDHAKKFEKNGGYMDILASP